VDKKHSEDSIVDRSQDYRNIFPASTIF
jgi:hypothetical protein